MWSLHLHEINLETRFCEESLLFFLGVHGSISEGVWQPIDHISVVVIIIYCRDYLIIIVMLFTGMIC